MLLNRVPLTPSRRAPRAQHLAKLGAERVRDALPLDCRERFSLSRPRCHWDGRRDPGRGRPQAGRGPAAKTRTRQGIKRARVAGGADLRPAEGRPKVGFVIPSLAGYITYTPKQELWKKNQSLEAQLEFRASFLDHKNSNLRNYTPLIPPNRNYGKKVNPLSIYANSARHSLTTKIPT